MLILLLILTMLAHPALAQPARTFALGSRATPWESGGRGRKPEVIVNAFRGVLDTTNAPGKAIDFAHRPGWIGPLRFDENQNIASRVLESGSVRAPNAGRGLEAQLKGVVNGDHLAAFERKPTLFEPQVVTRGIWLILDFATPVGVHRVRFYPRNTVEETPSAPFHNDFLRGYEVWINEVETAANRPDVLVERRVQNEEPVVDVQVPPQYARFVKIKSLAEVPFEIDEVEVYGTGFLQRGVYLSDIMDLGDLATVGFVEWVEEAVGNPDFSSVSVRARTGHDDTILVFRWLLFGEERALRDFLPFIEVPPEVYYALPLNERGAVFEDEVNWSPWFPVRNGELLAAPGPRRYVQFRLEFNGALFDARQVDELSFAYLVPPIAHRLVAEVFPRLAQAEKPASFRYAVRLMAEDGQIRGFDRLEVDTNVEVARVREVKLDGERLDFAVEFIREDGFGLSFPLIRDNGALLEFTFDLPIFRFGTTFSGRAHNSRAPEVPQALEAGDAVQFEPGDIPELSGLSVEIPRPQIGKLVGEISIPSPLFTPNGDGVNDSFEMFFNVLQLTEEAPVKLELYDLAGKKVASLFEGERGIGPVEVRWDGKLKDGSVILPGSYIWVLRIQADAFEERHTGVMGVAY